MDPNYAYWSEERSFSHTPTREKPGLLNRDTQRPRAGFWRIMGARTKHDTPVAIWYNEAGDMRIKIGRKKPIGENDTNFLSTYFMSCAAVSEEDYRVALESGVWPDGKISRVKDEEKPSGPVSSPDDAPAFADPNERGDLVHNTTNVADKRDEFVDQHDAMKEAINAVPKKITTQAEADKAAALVARLRTLWKDADTSRTIEKRPHDDAAKAVQARWLPLLGAISFDGDDLNGRVKDFLKAEERRIAEEDAARRREAEAEAEKNGEPVPEPEPAPKAKASSAYGRATTLTTRRYGKIVDQGKFVKAISDSSDFKEWLQNKANALARARTTVAGMEIEEIKE